MRMADVAADAVRPAGADEWFGPRQLRATVARRMQSANVEIVLVFGRQGRPHALGGMTAVRLPGRNTGRRSGRRGLRAPPVSCVLQPPADVEKREMLLVAGDGRGRQKTRRAVAGVGPADGAEGVVGAVHEVVAVAAVDVEIDEAGRQIAAGEVDVLAGRQCVVGAWTPVMRSAANADGRAKAEPIGQDDVGVDEESEHATMMRSAE